MNKIYKIVWLSIVFYLLNFNLSFALNPATHRTINDFVCQNSLNGFSLDLCLKDQLGFLLGIDEGINPEPGITKTVSVLIEDGGEFEDEPPWTIPYLRSVNHFHNPLTDGGFSGIWGTGFLAGESSILWSQKLVGEQGPGGHYSWHDVRDYFYKALTSSNNATRDDYFADTFRGLGQLMHLVQDLSVPEHARDDGHYTPAYEDWVNNSGKVVINPELGEVIIGDTVTLPQFFDPSAIGIPNSLGSVPVANLFDTNQYIQANTNPAVTLRPDIGLSEYTSANFLSPDTMFTNEFPFPKAEHTVIILDTPPDGIPNLDRQYLSSTNGHPGEQINHLAVVSYTNYFRTKYFPNISSEELPVYLDAVCYKDYASKLIPRAVGYSAGLLDYFFRGRLDIINAIPIKAVDGTITRIEFVVKNATPPIAAGQDVEPFETGKLVLAYKYTPAGASEAVFGFKDNIYPISDYTDPINSEYVHLSVTFPVAIPFGAQDLSFMLVFKGKLGNEDCAVVAKTIPTHPYTIAYFHQPGGPGNKSDIYTIFPDGTGAQNITEGSAPDSFYFTPAWSPDGSKLAFEEHFSTPYNRNIVVIDLTSEAPYPYNILRTLDNGDPSFIHDTAPSFSPDGTKIVALRSITNLDILVRGGLIIFEVASGNWSFVNDYAFWSQKDLNGAKPRWSPQDDKIAYYLKDEFDPGLGQWVFAGDIYLINPDGSGNLNLTHDAFTNTQPAWSPDGQSLVFVSDRDGQGYMDIWIMDRTGQNEQQIWNCNPNCWNPTFSPDGNEIIFKQGDDIYKVNIDSTGLTQVTTSGYLTGQPEATPFLLWP
ncbi:MAG: hypothetical protein P1P89_11990 [Desulfobacterales bacterium]|nr:hypothetical protein [Desulfobacterales bacterium]